MTRCFTGQQKSVKVLSVKNWMQICQVLHWTMATLGALCVTYLLFTILTMYEADPKIFFLNLSISNAVGGNLFLAGMPLISPEPCLTATLIPFLCLFFCSAVCFLPYLLLCGRLFPSASAVSPRCYPGTCGTCATGCPCLI